MAKIKKKKKQDIKPPTPDIVKKRLMKGALRRVFRQSIELRFILQQARVELPPKTLKDGSIGAKNQVRYKCAECGNLFSQKNVAVDHINPVIPVYRSEEEMTIDEIAYGIWCDIDNLQAICATKLKDNGGVLSCHAMKSNFEGFCRNKFKENKLNNLDELHDRIKQYELEYKHYLYEKEIEKLAKEKRKLEKARKKSEKK